MNDGVGRSLSNSNEVAEFIVATATMMGRMMFMVMVLQVQAQGAQAQGLESEELWLRLLGGVGRSGVVTISDLIHRWF